MKRMICGVLAATSMAACVVTTTSCETNTPKVSLTLSFNGQTYELNYELDRRISPRTVKHFLFLAEKGYYDGLCVHDYDADADIMYTGGYTYTEGGDLEYRKYYDKVATYENFPVSVWASKEEGAKALYTLAGEFEKNNFSVDSGAARQTFGSLTMYYTDKDTDNRVCVEYLGERKGDKAWRDYEYNSATSLFYISLSTTSTRNSEYCTFAQLATKSKETLNDFVDALEAYIEENHDDEADNGFTNKESLYVNEDDAIEDGRDSVSYDVPKSAIVIESVKVNKY